MIHAIDPGVHLSAVAHGDKAAGLLCLHAIDNRATGAPLPVIYMGRQVWPPLPGDHVICEVPVFRVKHAQSISDLRGAVGKHEMIAQLCDARYTQRKPEEWKGQLKKPHHHRHMWEKVLTPFERNVIASLLRRTPDELHAWIVCACKALAVKAKFDYDARGHKIGRHTLKDNDALDAAALLMKETGRL